MTNEQFDALSDLMRLRQSPSRKAARLIFVDGVAQCDAARQCDISPQSVGNVVRSTRRALALVRMVTGVRVG